MRRGAIHAVFPAREMAVQSAPRSQEGASSIAHVTSIRHAHHHPHPPRAHATHSACLACESRMHINLKSNFKRDARAADNPRGAAPNAVLHVPRTSREARVECTR